MPLLGPYLILMLPLSSIKSWSAVPFQDPELQLMPDSSLRLRITASSVVPGSFNGRDVIDFQPGVEYDFPDQGAGGLAEVFLREGWAEMVGDEPETEAAQPVRTRGRKKGGA